MDLELGRLMTVFQNRAGVIDAKAVNAGLALKSAHSTGIKTRSVTGPAPLNLVGGYRFSNATEIEANLAGYIRATEACLLRDECVVELPTVESPPLISPDPFDIPSFLTAG